MSFVYPILCTSQTCSEPAEYKIAARWSDGLTEELKTYALACASCLADRYQHSLAKQQQCRLVDGEELDSPSIFKLDKHKHDQQLERMLDLEEKIRNATFTS